MLFAAGGSSFTLPGELHAAIDSGFDGAVVMRKIYGPEYPRTLGALMAWSGLNPAAPAVTDAAGTLDRRTFQNRVLRVAAGLRSAGVGPGARGGAVAAERRRLPGRNLRLRPARRASHPHQHALSPAEVGNLLRRSRAVALVTQWGFPPVDFPAIFAALPQQDRAALRCVLGLQTSLQANAARGPAGVAARGRRSRCRAGRGDRRRSPA